MGKINMNSHSNAIVLAEQQVTEARAAVLAEYQAAQAKLRRRVTSPLFIGGVLLGALVLGYLYRRSGKPEAVVCAASPGAWTQVLRTVQVLVPLW